MCAPSHAVRPLAGGVPRRAAAAPSDASERAASGKKRPRAAPARDSSACLTKITRNSNSAVTTAGMEVFTVGVEMSSSQELLKKRLASELDALHGLLKKAELISRRGSEACQGGAPTAVKKEERFLAPKQRPNPMLFGGGNAPSAKRRKVSTPVEQKQKIQAPRMSAEERNQILGRLSSLCVEVPEHIVEFLQKQFGDADANGEIAINMDSVEDSVLLELKTLLDKVAEKGKDDKLAKESKDDKLAEESKDTSAQQPSEPASGTAQSTAQAESGSGESTSGAAPPTVAASEAPQGGEAKEVQDVLQRAAPKTVPMAALIYRAKLRRELLEMERAALPDQSIHPRDLKRLGISEYGHPSIMRQLGLVLKADA